MGRVWPDHRSLFGNSKFFPMYWKLREQRRV